MSLTIRDVEMYLITVQKRNFYAHVLNSLKHVDYPGSNKFSIFVDGTGKYCFLYDSKWLIDSPLPYLVMLLEHEILHLILGHIPRILSYLSRTPDTIDQTPHLKTTINLAADLAVNEILYHAHYYDECKQYFSRTTRDRFTFYTRYDYPKLCLNPNDTLEYYLGQLLNYTKDKPISFNDNDEEDEYDDENCEDDDDNSEDTYYCSDLTARLIYNYPYTHDSFYGNATVEELMGPADLAQRDFCLTLKEVAKNYEKFCGSIPALIADIIQKSEEPPSVHWKSILRNTVTDLLSTKMLRSMHRPNKRLICFPDILPFPGKVPDKNFSVIFAVDTSGSMEITDISLAYRELSGLLAEHEGSRVTILQADARIARIETIQSIDDITYVAQGRGGTNFTPVFRHVKDAVEKGEKLDLIVYVTDGCASDIPYDLVPEIPVVWLLTPQGTRYLPCNFGERITIC